MIKLFRKDARNQRLKGIRLSARDRREIEAACDGPVDYQRGPSAANVIEFLLFCVAGLGLAYAIADSANLI